MADSTHMSKLYTHHPHSSSSMALDDSLVSVNTPLHCDPPTLLDQSVPASTHSFQVNSNTLRGVVSQWNANRLDLFELSLPDENNVFHGVMRFYYQDTGQKVATKCVRVYSYMSVQKIVEILIEKFRPDMRMLTTPRFALYEIHESGEERQLAPNEYPLYVQLNWHQDDREGRFLLRNLDDHNMSKSSLVSNGSSVSREVNGHSFKRKLSRREKKELRKLEKQQNISDRNMKDPSVAEKLYNDIPETSFTRSISNPEAVMRRRRQQKLERRLHQYRSKDGGPDTGGTLKIYGESLCRDVPYKTLLLSVGDKACDVVREMLDKYAMFKEETSHYCLVQIITEQRQPETNEEYHAPIGPYREYILDDLECPLALLMNHPPSPGSIMFHIRRRSSAEQSRRRKKKSPSSAAVNQVNGFVATVSLPCTRDSSAAVSSPVGPAASAASPVQSSMSQQQLPYLLQLNSDGSQITSRTPLRFPLHLNVTEVGSSTHLALSSSTHRYFYLNNGDRHDSGILEHHCVLAHTDNIVTITPCERHAVTRVNGQVVYETTILQNSCVIHFGRDYCFRFINPNQSLDTSTIINDSQQFFDSSSNISRQGDVETTFGVNGNVETRPASICHSANTMRNRWSSRLSNISAPCANVGDSILPAVMEFREETEDNLLTAIVTRLDPGCVQFKLAPTYTLYMAARFRASTHYRPELDPNERASRLTVFLIRVANFIQSLVQMKKTNSNHLAFWMANSSEYLHFLKKDRHLSAYSSEAHIILADTVQCTFWYLVEFIQSQLSDCIVNFFDERDDSTEENGTTTEVLSVLASSMSLLRRCRVNAALTIQLFSQLFHYINMRVFNIVVGVQSLSSPTNNLSNFCSRFWGIRLKRRLARVENWSARLGLELAADCHLGRVLQAIHLLTMDKSSYSDLTNTCCSTCYKLNSVQLRTILRAYMCEEGEASCITSATIDSIVQISQTNSDELARKEGRRIGLAEDVELQLPFLLPEDGYSCDVVRGVPNGLPEFVAPLQRSGMVRFSEQPSSTGYWTIYMVDSDTCFTPTRGLASSVHNHTSVRSQLHTSNVLSGSMSSMQLSPEIMHIQLQKSVSGMGLSIVAARGAGQERLGIYVKSVVAGGAADADGRISAGDQLLQVDNQSLQGISQEQAAEYMMRTGPWVNLVVAKRAAVFHGLSALLSQPSPAASITSFHHSTNQIQTSNSVPALTEAHHPASSRHAVEMPAVSRVSTVPDSVTSSTSTQRSLSAYSLPHVSPPGTRCDVTNTHPAVQSPHPSSIVRSLTEQCQLAVYPQPDSQGTHRDTQSVTSYREMSDADSHRPTFKHSQLSAAHSHQDILSGSAHLHDPTLDRSHFASSECLLSTNDRHRDSGISRDDRHTDSLMSRDDPHRDSLMSRDDRHTDSLMSRDERHTDSLMSRDDRHTDSLMSRDDRHTDSLMSRDDRHTDSLMSRDDRHTDSLMSRDERFAATVHADHLQGGPFLRNGSACGDRTKEHLKARREEMRRKEVELEATKRAEELLLREAAQRRRAQTDCGSGMTHRPHQRDMSAAASSFVDDAQRMLNSDCVLTAEVTEEEGEGGTQAPRTALSVSNTPGVIGSQEVYRDPRLKRLNRIQEMKTNAHSFVPENLTFKEKMRMFAHESGEMNTPKGKLKASGRQRELEVSE